MRRRRPYVVGGNNPAAAAGVGGGGVWQQPSYTQPLAIPDNPAPLAGGGIWLCGLSALPALPSTADVLSGEFVRQPTPAEELDDILGILRVNSDRTEPRALGPFFCGCSGYAPGPEPAIGGERPVLSGEFLRQQTPQEELDDILGILRPRRGHGHAGGDRGHSLRPQRHGVNDRRGFELHRPGESVAASAPR